MFQINWKLKALLYKVLFFVKFTRIFYLLQKYITKRSKVEINKINELWVYHTKTIEEYNVKSVLEVGAGKSLSQNIYIAYKFNNAIEQTAVDIDLMIDFELVNNASEQISNILGLKNKGKVKNFDNLKKFYNIKYKAPCSLHDLKKNDDKFDICISTTALEHFTKEDLKKYLSDLKNILTKNILISSNIDYSDHYSHTDTSIGSLNYLSFSNKEWEKYDNSYLFQNRLRHQDYKRIFKDSGYKIKKIIEGRALQAPKNICSEFDIENKETYIGWAYFVIELNKAS